MRRWSNPNWWCPVRDSSNDDRGVFGDERVNICTVCVINILLILPQFFFRLFGFILGRIQGRRRERCLGKSSDKLFKPVDGASCIDMPWISTTASSLKGPIKAGGRIVSCERRIRTNSISVDISIRTT
jgi:hypothetical protein